MEAREFAAYVNRHIDPASDLPKLSTKLLAQWHRLGLLMPDSIKGYSEMNLQRALALLMLMRNLMAQPVTGNVAPKKAMVK